MAFTTDELAPFLPRTITATPSGRHASFNPVILSSGNGIVLAKTGFTAMVRGCRTGPHAFAGSRRRREKAAGNIESLAMRKPVELVQRCGAWPRCDNAQSRQVVEPGETIVELVDLQTFKRVQCGGPTKRTGIR